MAGPESALLVGVGGALGAVLRHQVSELVGGGQFPRATLTVNVLGTFALGLVAFGAPGGRAALLLGTGACGAFTTFSSFSVDAVRLHERGRRVAAALYAGGTLVLAAAALGLAWLVV